MSTLEFPTVKGAQVGEGTYGGLSIHDYGDTPITIGKYCSTGNNSLVILGGEHNTDWVSTFAFETHFPGCSVSGHPATRGPITIGNDVWIGTEAVILSGTTIGDGAVIGARAVVRGCIPPYAIASGNPARVLLYRFDPGTIQALLRIRWWDWPRERIERAIPLLCQRDIGKFIRMVDAGEL